MRYLLNIDIGGTHTDGVAIDQNGEMTSTKVSSTPDDFSDGFFHCLEELASQLSRSVKELLAETELVSHGTTVGTNAILEGEGSNVALITTAGHEDALRIMRGAVGRANGLPVEDYLRMQTVDKPDPLIPRNRVFGISERRDSMGDEVVAFNEEEAQELARTLDNRDIKAIGVSFLWSFLDDGHEKRMEEILKEEVDRDLFLSLGSDLTPSRGEYERTTAAVINSFIGPPTSEYLKRIDDRLIKEGYDGTLLVMQVGGGLTPVEDAVDEPIRTIDSGPVAGVTGCSYLADELGDKNIIAADMGGTSFDVGLITNNSPITRATNTIRQYEYRIRNVDITSIGNGGGSIAWVEEGTDRLRIGPESAGANPGPACYDEGGESMTITDSDLLCGFLDPDYFLGGRKQLSVKKAEAAASRIADDIDMDVDDVASGVLEIANAQMGDLISQETINKGYDPRDFSIYAYGGAGALHLPMIAQQLGVNEVVIPLGNSASVWSAVGISSSDVLYREELSATRMFAPFDSEEVSSLIQSIEQQISRQLLDAGFDDDDITLNRYATIKYGRQVHEITVPIPNGDLTDTDMQNLIQEFERRYEDLYGEGAGASESGYELVTIRCDGYGNTPSPELNPTREITTTLEPKTDEAIYWPTSGERLKTSIYYEDDFERNAQIEGPAVVRLSATTVTVPPKSVASIDVYGNVRIKPSGDVSQMEDNHE
jgi:N-methylhydantoinase A